MAYGRILFDVAVFMTPSGDRSSATKGQVAEMTDDEFKRLEALGAVEKAAKGDADADPSTVGGAKPQLVTTQNPETGVITVTDPATGDVVLESGPDGAAKSSKSAAAESK